VSHLRVLVSPDPVTYSTLWDSCEPPAPDRWIAWPSERQVNAFRSAAGIAPPAVKTNRAGDGLISLRSVPGILLDNRSRSDPNGKTQPISSTFRRLLTRAAIQRVLRQGPEDYFGRVRDTAGFPAALTELIRELKQACVNPKDLERATETASAMLEAESDARFGDKSREIVRLYQAVEESQRAGQLLDEDDLIPEALTALRRREVSKLPKSLDVIGFYQFTAAQLTLLAGLAAARVDVRIHLLYDESRPILFTAAGRTLQRLLAEFQAIAEQPVAPVKKRPTIAPAPLLQTLERSLFAPVPFPNGASMNPVPPAGSSFTVLEAPGDYVEAEVIALRIHQLHAVDGVAYRDCAVVVRSVGEHAARLRCVFHRFNVPLAATTLEPLMQNPAVQFLSRLFRLIPGRWTRENLIRVLHSSYLGLDLHAVDRLDRAARREGAIEDPDRWLSLAARQGNHRLLVFVGKLVKWRSEVARPARAREQLVWLRRNAIFSLLGPAAPGSAGEADAPEELAPQVGSVSKRLKDRLSPTDRAALLTAAHVAGEMERVRRLNTDSIDAEVESESAPVNAVEIVEDLLALWEHATYAPSHSQEDAVQLLDAYALSPAEFPVVFVSGLLEGSFPRRVPENPFFRDDEREALRPHGVHLSTALEGADEERILFYRAVTAARDRLFLTFPRVTDEGKESLPSFYLDEVKAVVGDLTGYTVSRTLSEVAPKPDEVITERDQACAVAIAAGDWRKTADDGFMERLDLYNKLVAAEPALLARLLDGVDRTPPYQLQCGWSQYDQQRSFGVSEIEAFATCPYQFFASRRLRLSPDRDAPGRLEGGAVMHNIVRRFLEELGAAPLPPKDEAIVRLEALLDEELADLPREAQPYQIRVLRLTLAALLPAFVDREEAYREYTRLKPGRWELAFGNSSNAAAEGETPDSASCSAPLLIEADGAEPVRIHGRIDRVDFSPDGTAALMDYKLGAARTLKDMQEGKSLQIPLYFLAMEKVFNLEAAAAFYDCFDRNERTIIIRSDHVQQIMTQPSQANGGILPGTKYEELLKTATTAVIVAAGRIADCRIETQRGDHCRICDFGDVCRV